jgi:hypothetical protein
MILADKESAQGFKYPAGGKILVQKRNNRWLCLPSKANTYLRQHNTLLRRKKNKVRGNTKKDLKQLE